MSSATKEDVYDEEINPLMAQIIEICEANNIGFAASFFLGEGMAETLACTSFKIGEDCQVHPNFKKSVKKFVRSLNAD